MHVTNNNTHEENKLCSRVMGGEKKVRKLNLNSDVKGRKLQQNT
jgi:hypothetical protein